MTPIIYRTGDATAPVERPAMIVHVANDSGGWGHGFVLAISKRWSTPENAYRTVHRSSGLKLGTNQIAGVAVKLWVVNMVAQHGYTSEQRSCALDHEALAKCLLSVCWEAKERSAGVHMPRIGCGLGGSTWNRVEPLILENLSANDVPVFVYDKS